MLSYFPTPHNDEILYSIFSRYHIKSGNLSCKQSLKELLNNESAIATIDFPSHIDNFCSNFPHQEGFSSDNFIRNHTMLPLYTPFITKKLREEIINQMKSTNGKGIYMKIGAMASTVSSYRNLRYCPACIKEDIQRVGEPYWHRIHQVPGVFICPHHKTQLLDACRVCGEVVCAKKKYGLVNLKERCSKGHSLCGDITENTEVFEHKFKHHYLSIARAMNRLLTTEFGKINITDIHGLYINALKQNGFLTNNGSIRQVDLHGSLLEFYSEEFLEKLQLDRLDKTSQSWLTDLVRNRIASIHPLKHLLLILFLSNSLEEFLGVEKEEYDYFGNGPWPCLNPIANHYKNNVVEECIVTTCTATKRPVGTFRCKCGFIYSRRGPDHSQEDKYKIGRMKQFGVVWEDRLKELIYQGNLSLRQISKKMSADPGTIKKYTIKLGLTPTWEVRVPFIEKTINNKDKHIVSNVEDLREKYRKELMNLILRDKSHITRTDARKKLPKEYAWIYKHDKSWLDIALPSKKIKVLQPEGRVNWNERDIEISRKVKDKINELLSSDELIRITINRIGELTGYKAILEKHIDKLPKTKETLDKSIETVEDFQIRKVLKVADRLTKKEGIVKEWELLKEAGIKSNCTKEVRKEIQRQVDRNLLKEQSAVYRETNDRF